ncbi:MAG: hypothetical protein QXD32_02975, partial [Nitrososphaerota archaeon]
MARALYAAVVAVLLAGLAAGALLILQTRPVGQYFIVDVQGERFTIYVTDPETIRLAEENMRGGNNLFPTGALARGDGGFNKPWSWHLIPETVRMAEVSIELCDGLPSHIEQDLDYWIDTVGQFCPWSGRIVG